MNVRAVIGFALLFALPAAATRAADWRIDPVHSRVVFTVDHAGFSQAIGTLSAPRGWLRFDPDDWPAAAVEVEIDLSTLDLGDGDWNQRVHRRDFLDSKHHPVARFSSGRIEPLDADDAGSPADTDEIRSGITRARVHGTLRVRGEAHPVTLDVRLNRLARHPLSLRRTVGFSATATLSRAALGMRSWKRLVGDDVMLWIELEAQRARRRDDHGQQRNREPDDAPAQ